MLAFTVSIRIASIWSIKARQWISGRKDIFEQMESTIDSTKGPIVWMHCASLGEFEQGRPVLESIRKSHPQYRILLTFFSPSGYEVRKNTELADWVFYLPLDGRRNSNRFLEITQPSIAIFVKYESWFHYLYALKKRKIPSILISAFFRKEQSFFGPLGGLLRKMLDLYSFIFVQDTLSSDLMKKYAIKAPHAIAGDTRFDRVLELSSIDFHHGKIENFISEYKVIVAGSTWKEDEVLLHSLYKYTHDLKFIIAPHELSSSHIENIKAKFEDCLLLSDLEKGREVREERVLLIDCFGMLSKLYRFGTICYIGGGFNKSGIHNILEAAAYGKLVYFGPNHRRTAEAGELMGIGAGFSVSSSEEFIMSILPLIEDKQNRQALEKKATHFVHSRSGATAQIMAYVSKILNSFH